MLKSEVSQLLENSENLKNTRVGVSSTISHGYKIFLPNKWVRNKNDQFTSTKKTNQQNYKYSSQGLIFS